MLELLADTNIVFERLNLSYNKWKQLIVSPYLLHKFIRDQINMTHDLKSP